MSDEPYLDRKIRRLERGVHVDEHLCGHVFRGGEVHVARLGRVLCAALRQSGPGTGRARGPKDDAGSKIDQNQSKIDQSRSEIEQNQSQMEQTSHKSHLKCRKPAASGE